MLHISNAYNRSYDMRVKGAWFNRQNVRIIVYVIQRILFLLTDLYSLDNGAACTVRVTVGRNSIVHIKNLSRTQI